MSSAPIAMSAHRLHPTILRAYDIRGIVGETFHPQDVRLIGQAFGLVARETFGKEHPRICVARDGRLSSPGLSQALIEGLTQAGVHVLDCGLGPTPMLYYAVYEAEADGGLMITGSHNPPTHNGIKMMLGKASFFGDQIMALGERIHTGTLLEGDGSCESYAIKPRYIAYMDQLLAKANGLKLVWDAGNGAAGEVVQTLCANNQTHAHTTLFTEIDGTFPNHHPDPSIAENLEDLRAAVASETADIGLAFDGDGDRLGVVDDKGRMVGPDHLLMLLAQDVLQRAPGAKMIADVKTSGIFFEAVRASGGEALMYKTGHSHIKSKMKEIGAAFAGEASGHIFFADEYYGFDDGIYAALRLINAVAASGKRLSELVDALPTPLSTPELKISVSDEQKFGIIEAVQNSLEESGADMVTIDGVRVNTADGWWLLRASNTQAALIARCESTTQDGLERLITQLKESLAPHGISVSPS